MIIGKTQRNIVTKLTYALSRCRKDDSLYGDIHGAMDDCKTLCGKTIDSNWYITKTSAHDNCEDSVTCRTCKKHLTLTE